MTRTITLDAAASVDIGQDWARTRRIQVENRPASAGTLYYGAVPAPDIVVDADGPSFVVAGFTFDLITAASGLALEVGMLCDAGPLLPGGTYITAINGKQITVSQAVADTSPTVESLTFSYPAISETNGHELAAGQRESFAHGEFQAGRSIRLLAGTGGCTVTITEARN